MQSYETTAVSGIKNQSHANDQEASRLLEIARSVLRQESQSLLALADTLNTDFIHAIDAILRSPGRAVVTGMGKSGIIGRKIAATFSSTGTQCFFMHPGEAYHGDLGMVDSSDVIIAISNSGETDEVLRLIPFFRQNNNTLIGISSNSESTLARNADIHIDLNVREEACPLNLAPTTSTTATLALGDAIAVTLMKLRGFQPENFAKFHPGGSLGRRLLTKAKDVMATINLPLVREETPLKEVVFTITSCRKGIAIVVDEGKRLIGVITDGDLRRVMANELDVSRFTAGEIMTVSSKSIFYNVSVADAEDVMKENHIKELVVVDEKNQVVGLLEYFNG